MRTRGKVLLALALCLTLLTTQLQITKANSLIPDSLVQHTQADTQVIPDSYNTGCKGILTPISMNGESSTTLYDLTIVSGNNNKAFVLDFAYRNKDISGTVYIENYDFSARSLNVYNEDKVDREIKLIFNNCKFSTVGVAKGESNMSYEFNNCSMNSFYGSNATFNQCRFGDSNADGLVPFRNIQVNNCFFTKLGTTASTSGRHIDGTHIYGHEGIDVQNVHFNNCRFAIPPLTPAGSTSYINACIMLSLEYSNGNNISFNNIHVNGGGYSIYTGVKYSSLTLENVSLSNIYFGCANKYGLFYPNSPASVQKTNILSADSLYVGSVWKENGQTHFSVTNDTNQERTLLIYTDAGTYTYTIPACLTGNQITASTTYNDFPFDIDIAVPTDCQYAVCYDNTIPGCAMQLRFTNWSNNDVRLNDDIINTLYGGNNDSFVEGECGKNITFTLKKNGVLILTGSGSTDNYHSGKAPGWEDYKDYIKEVQIGSGITKLGSMLFRSCTSLRSIQLPATLETISGRAFQGCSSLQTAYYAGTEADWTKVNVETYNDELLNALSFQVDETPAPVPDTQPTQPPLVSPPDAPTAVPTTEPTAIPTTVPTVEPTQPPLVSPPDAPVVTPTAPPLVSPPDAPVITPTVAPTAAPTAVPTVAPTIVPTTAPTVAPTAVPTAAPTVTSISIVSESNSPINITAIENAQLTIPQGGQLNVGSTTLSDTEYTAAKAKGFTDAQLKNAIAFHMDITDANGQKLQLKAPVHIRFTIPEALRGKDLCLLHYASSGLELLDVSVSGDTGEAIVTSFSNFALLQALPATTAAPKMGEDTTVLYLLYTCILGLLLLAAADTIVYQCKKHYRK